MVADKVVREALRLLKERDETQRQRLEELRREILKPARWRSSASSAAIAMLGRFEAKAGEAGQSQAGWWGT